MIYISAKYIHTCDERGMVADGCVCLAEDGTVIEVLDCVPEGVEVRHWDGALVPGFVNAHCHVELSHLKGKFRKGSGMAGFIDQINELRDSVSSDRKKVLLQEEMDRMWSEGVQAMADISNCSDSFAAKAASPMYTRTFIEVFGTEPEDCDKVMEGARALCAEADKAALDASITPHACYTMSPQLLTAASAAGLSRGWISYHSQESSQEEQMIASGTGEMAENRRRAGMSTPPVTGKSSLEYFIDRLGQGLPAPFAGHILLVHNVCLTEPAAKAALEVMPEVFWAVCPRSNIFIHNALPPIPLMRRLGLRVCVGTDSLSSNDSLDMLAEIFCLQENFPEVPVEEIFRWACLNGAAFLGKDDIMGSITPGKKPGLVGISSIADDGRLTVGSRSFRLV